MAALRRQDAASDADSSGGGGGGVDEDHFVRNAERGDNNEQDADDIWATAEGYTPLQDAATATTAGGALFSTGLGSTVFVSHPGAFFANMMAFDDHDDDDVINDDIDEEDLDSSCDEGNTSNINNSANDYAVVPLETDEQYDFRALASTTLMALEGDYHRTISRQVAAAVGREDSPPLSSSTGSPTVRPDTTAALSAIETSDTDVPFVADFEAVPWTDTATHTNVAIKEVPPIDTEAVKRAVQTIQLRDPRLQQHFQEWEQSKVVVPSRLHPIILTAPLAAFRKQTSKAKQASANLSRSACIAEALQRLDLLKSSVVDDVKTTLRIHVVGCDAVECGSQDRLRVLFGPVVRWVAAYAESPNHVEMHLIGPNIPKEAMGWTTLDLMPPPNINVRKRLESASLQCHGVVYEEWLSSLGEEDQNLSPDLAIAFNAGVWGYREWKTTIEYLLGRRTRQLSSQEVGGIAIPFVFTAYTLQEAEDDYEVIQSAAEDIAKKSKDETDSVVLVWDPEINAFASRLERETASAAPGRVYRENAAWQCWRL
jgi:hypothetical protein